jgi:hypothetical protein
MAHVTCLARLRQPADHADAGLRRARLLQRVMKPFLNPVVSLADEGRLRSAAASLDAAPLLG